MHNLEYHKKLICGTAQDSSLDELLESYVEACWDDAIKSKTVKGNTASEKELKEFSAFIVEGFNMEHLINAS